MDPKSSGAGFNAGYVSAIYDVRKWLQDRKEVFKSDDMPVVFIREMIEVCEEFIEGRMCCSGQDRDEKDIPDEGQTESSGLGETEESGI